MPRPNTDKSPLRDNSSLKAKPGDFEPAVSTKEVPIIDPPDGGKTPEVAGSFTPSGSEDSPRC